MTFAKRLFLIGIFLLAACGTSPENEILISTTQPEPTQGEQDEPTAVPSTPDESAVEEPSPIPVEETPEKVITEETAVPQEEQEAPSPDPFGANETVHEQWIARSLGLGIKPAIAIDTQDTPHITYMAEEIHGYVHYMKLDGGEGETAVTVAEGYFYGPPAIAVGPDDQPYIVYHDHQDESFKPDLGDAVLAFQGETGWEISTIEHPGHDGWDNDVAVSSDGVVHTVSVDAQQFGSTDGVEYALLTDEGWVVENIGSVPVPYEFCEQYRGG